MLIDGPSGAGKTTYANRLGEMTGWRVVHLDDFYPGWGGLAEGARMVVEDVLDPVDPGFTRWDWNNSRPAERVTLDPEASLIVEGVGAITKQSVAAAAKLGEVHTIHITAASDARFRRAIARDPGYRAWWQMWARQEEAHFSGDGDVAAEETITW
ncbi:hypothetical protein CGUA_04940 [Corynebacterium guangdongense]|nr:hypothetical protein CGUA_04940 [Corynebacterium guangdongense]